MNLVNELRERKSERERQKFISTLSLSFSLSMMLKKENTSNGKYM